MTESLIDRIQINTQSSIRIQCPGNGSVLYSDPFKIPREAHDADVIFLTHDHYDHFDPDSIRKVVKDATIFVVPEKMQRQAGPYVPAGGSLITVRPGMKLDAAGVSVETVPAYNLVKTFHPKRSGWVGYILTIDGRRVYIAGDTDMTRENRAVRCDIALVPIGGTFTMDAKKAAELINIIRPETAIPIHYGSVVGSRSDADVFRRNVDPGIEVVVKL